MREPGVVPISRPHHDPLRAFCEELNSPLEEVFNLMYLATHVDEQPAAELHLKRALEALAKVRRTVISHCSAPEERRRA